jgi:hypothetical protein
MTIPADSWIINPAGPATLLSRRFYGSLGAITDSERRALRSIGLTAQEVAARTGGLLAASLALPGVRIFQGVRPATADVPRIPHAINSGSRVILVESVAWPPGRYVVMPTGRIHCDDVYIGQSVRPLISAVRHWRSTLPRGHRVSAMVVVHPTSDGGLALPAPQGRDLAWTRAATAVCDIRACLPPGRQRVSIRAVAALIAATAEEEIR